MFNSVKANFLKKLISSCIVDGKLNKKKLVFKLAHKLNLSLSQAWFIVKETIKRGSKVSVMVTLIESVKNLINKRNNHFYNLTQGY